MMDSPPCAMSVRVNGMREEWICDSVKREYWCTIICNERGVGSNVPSSPRCKELPSSGGRYWISSTRCFCEGSELLCKFNILQRMDETFGQRGGTLAKLNMSVRHPLDENLNLIQVENIILPFNTSNAGVWVYVIIIKFANE